MQSNACKIFFFVDNTPVDEHLKALHIDTLNRNETSSRIGDSGYTSLPGLPYTGLITPINTLELCSRIAETEIGENSSVAQSDIDSQREVCFKNSAKNSTYNQHPESYELKGVKVNLYNPKASYNVNLESVNKSKVILDNPLRGSVHDESAMSAVSSVWGDDRDFISTSGSENWEVPSSQILEQLSNTGTKGSHRSEIQLR